MPRANRYFFPGHVWHIHNLPTATVKAASGKARGVNGWNFWYIKDENGDWVKLNQYVE